MMMSKENDRGIRLRRARSIGGKNGGPRKKKKDAMEVF
jgi:hypothetical protein